MRPHERLDVWTRSIDLSVLIYETTEPFPKREWYGLSQQIRRAAVSISSNIAEGCARKSQREFLHYLAISQGSASEVATQALIAARLGFIRRASYEAIYKETEDIGKMISGLRRSIQIAIAIITISDFRFTITDERDSRFTKTDSRFPSA